MHAVRFGALTFPLGPEAGFLAVSISRLPPVRALVENAVRDPPL